MGLKETIDWTPANTKPDSDTTVLICSPASDDPVWLGYWDDEDGVWRDVNAGGIEHQVTHWANVPAGPRIL